MKEIKNKLNISQGRSFLIKKIYYLLDRLENNNNYHPNVNGEYEFLTKFINLNKDKHNLVILDVGANIGDYSEKIVNMIEESMPKASYDLHIFEPAEVSFSELKSRFYQRENIILNNYGLSDTSGSSTMYYDEEKSGLASLYKRNLDYYNIAFNHSEIIKLNTLKEYIKDNDIKHINFIKIDVEGNELKVLQGMEEYLNNNFVDFIQFEYGGTNLDSRTSLADFYNLLKDKGFRIAKIMPNRLDYRIYQPEMDTFRYANYVAVSNKIIL